MNQVYKVFDGCRSLAATAVAVAKSSAVHTACTKAKRETATLFLQTGQLVVLSTVLALVTPFATVSDRVAKAQQKCLSLMQARLEGVASPGAVQRHETTSGGYKPQEKRLQAAQEKLEAIRANLSDGELMELRAKLARAAQLVRSKDNAKLKASNATLFQMERQLTIASFNTTTAVKPAAAPRCDDENEEKTPVEKDEEEESGETGSMQHLAGIVQRSAPTASALKERLARIFQSRDPIDEQLDAWRSAAPAR